MDTADITMVVFHSDSSVQSENRSFWVLSLKYLNNQLYKAFCYCGWKEKMFFFFFLIYLYIIRSVTRTPLLHLKNFEVVRQELTNHWRFNTITTLASGFTVKEWSKSFRKSKA